MAGLNAAAACRRAGRAVLLALACLGLAPGLGGMPAGAAEPAGCQAAAGPGCYQGFEAAPGGGRLHYYASQPPGSGATAALVVVHGHPRDAARSFAAGLRAAEGAGLGDATLVAAPLFQVDPARAARCDTPGNPPPQPGDLLWTCASWLDGGLASDGATGAFAALDALLAELARRWPGLRTITLAGFSAGGQMVQHYIGFAHPPRPGPALRYVVADPGTWLYFDPERPADAAALAACPDYDRWKYGSAGLPAHLGRDAAAARAAYAAADIQVLEGALDSGDGPGAYHRILDRSCAAMAQGPFRLQRGQAYAEHERRVLRPAGERGFTVVPGCAHDVACVLPAPAARAALFGTKR